MIKPDNVLKEINLLLLEYKSTDDDSRIVNVLEAVDKEKQLSKQEGIEEEKAREANAFDDDGNPVKITLS